MGPARFHCATLLYAEVEGKVYGQTIDWSTQDYHYAKLYTRSTKLRKEA